MQHSIRSILQERAVADLQHLALHMDAHLGGQIQAGKKQVMGEAEYKERQLTAKGTQRPYGDYSIPSAKNMVRRFPGMDRNII